MKVSIRKRTRKAKDGKTATRWQIDYTWPPGLDPDTGEPRGTRYRPSVDTKKQAEKVRDQIIADVQSGRFRGPSSVQLRDAISFEELAKEFLKNHTGKRRSNHYPSNLRMMLEEGLRDLDIRSFDRTAAEQYRRRLETQPRLKAVKSKDGKVRFQTFKTIGQGKKLRKASLPPVGPATVVKRLRALHRLLRYAVQRGYIPYNPVAEMEKPSLPKHRDRWLTREEFDQVCAASPPWLRPMLEFAVATGMRLKEITELTWGEVDRSNRIVHVPMDSKTGTRQIRLSASAGRVLEEQGKVRSIRTKRVFRYDDGGAIDTDRKRERVSHWTQAAAKSAGVPGVGFHTLRHTAASWMVQAGVSLYEVQKVLGHSSPMLTQRYGHLAPGYGEAAADAIDRMFAQPAGTQSAHDNPNSTHRTAVRG